MVDAAEGAEGVAEAAESGVQHYEGGSGLVLIGEVGGHEEEEEGEEVGRGGEGLRGYCCVAHSVGGGC